jgi:type I restriction enzyme, S subunit
MVEVIDIGTGFRKTEIGMIPSDWDMKNLGDVGEVKMCRRVFNHETKSTGEIPFYKIGTFGQEADAYISQELFDTYRQKFSFPKKGDILISAAGTIGRTIVYDGMPAYFQDSNIVWLDNNETLVSNGFLYHVLQVIKYNTEGGTIQRLYNSILKSTIFACPTDPDEQKAIATALNDADKQIAELEKLIAKKRNIRQSAMQELLKPKAGWIEKRLNEIGVFKKGRNIPKISLQDEGVPCVLYGEIYTTYNFHTSELISKISRETAKDATKINFGDILFAGSGETAEDIGKCFVYTGTEEAYAGGDVIILSPNDCDEIFLGFLLNSYSVIKQKSQLGQGSSVFHIYPYHLKLIQVSVPSSKDEQKQIGKILIDMVEELEAMAMKLEKYKMIKQGMMQNLLTGKIRLV